MNYLFYLVLIDLMLKGVILLFKIIYIHIYTYTIHISASRTGSIKNVSVKVTVNKKKKAEHLQWDIKDHLATFYARKFLFHLL